MAVPAPALFRTKTKTPADFAGALMGLFKRPFLNLI
jgi:hypothetical protein